MPTGTPVVLNDSLLRDLYLVEGLSTRRIASVMGTHATVIARRLKKLDVALRPVGRPHENLAGQEIGRWRVLSFAKSHGTSCYWHCLCLDCQATHMVLACNLKSDKSSRCRSCAARFKGGACGQLCGNHWTSIVRTANKRGLVVAVEKKMVWELFLTQRGQCAISGVSINLAPKAKDRTASLDRIDPSVGYVPGNVWWVHKHVNQMKWNFRLPYFLEMCVQITEYQKSEAKVFGVDQ